MGPGEGPACCVSKVPAAGASVGAETRKAVIASRDQAGNSAKRWRGLGARGVSMSLGMRHLDNRDHSSVQSRDNGI